MRLECLSKGLGLICEFHGFIWQDSRKMWVRITMTLLQGDLSEQGRLRNLPAFSWKETWMGNSHGALGVHWLNSQKSWAKDTFGFGWVTWAKYNSMMSLPFDSFTLILFCHLLEKSKQETVGQYDMIRLSIQNWNIKQWVHRRARLIEQHRAVTFPGTSLIPGSITL